MLAALVAAFVGRWVFDQPSVLVAILIATAATAVSLALVEFLDRDSSTRTGPALSPPKPPAAWWPPEAPSAPPPATLDGRVHAAMIDVTQRSRGTAERLYQCPTCGGFDIARGHGGAHRCNECGSSWNWQTPAPWPRVAIDVKARSGGVAMNRRAEKGR